jgi:hypothetical protein
MGLMTNVFKREREFRLIGRFERKDGEGGGAFE